MQARWPNISMGELPKSIEDHRVTPALGGPMQPDILEAATKKSETVSILNMQKALDNHREWACFRRGQISQSPMRIRRCQCHGVANSFVDLLH
ncbi:hypothetical protein I7I53_01334 [Histoplasma capsulatum var. duboisii H88]|uniref:Uncharacterized protein n=1 Tax=Ajellomyces capsulatus (strain H88) TaxID=544711 RepID=A0A8A1LLK9_AJEC8|nr:hypothetical protein I7I53_01334 [Histoplasma capsulatum var. duboisii H88]